MVYSILPVLVEHIDIIESLLFTSLLFTSKETFLNRIIYVCQTPFEKGW